MNSFGTVGDIPIPIRLTVWPTCCYFKQEYPDDPFFTYLAELHLISFNAPTWTYRCDSWGCFPCEPSLVKSLWGLHGVPQVSDVHLWIICTTLYDFQVCLSDFGLGIWPPQPFPPVPVTDLLDSEGITLNITPWMSRTLTGLLKSSPQVQNANGELWTHLGEMSCIENHCSKLYHQFHTRCLPTIYSNASLRLTRNHCSKNPGLRCASTTERTMLLLLKKLV